MVIRDLVVVIIINQSIHAEQLAIEYCRKHDKRNKFKIYIGRYAKDGHLKPAYCCRACSQLVTKYKYQDRGIFTLNEGEFVTAIKEILNPVYLIKILHG